MPSPEWRQTPARFTQRLSAVDAEGDLYEWALPHPDSDFTPGWLVDPDALRLLPAAQVVRCVNPPCNGQQMFHYVLTYVCPYCRASVGVKRVPHAM